jgi:sporulation integral membrane protein YlbJ
MPPRWIHSRSFASTLMLGLVVALLVWFIVSYPESAFEASLSGLSLWWRLIFPALLPFLMLTELLAGFGVLHAAGVLLDPLLRRLFGIPGAGGYAVAVGLVGGFTAGPDAITKLYGRGLVCRDDAERLIALTHISNPVTMVTIIGVGMLNSPQAGVMIAIIHYSAGLAVGLLLPIVSKRKRAEQVNPSTGIRQQHELPKQNRKSNRSKSLIRQAVVAMQEARRIDGRTFGKLLGDAVLSSNQSLLLLGGFVMLFSVFEQWIRQLLLAPIEATGLVASSISMLLETHIGSIRIAKLEDLSMLWKIALIGATLGWSGLAQHAQVLGLARGAGLRFKPFLVARGLHAAIAFLLTFALWDPLARLLHWSVPGFMTALDNVYNGAAFAPSLPAHFPLFGYADAWQALGMALLLLVATGASFGLLRLLVQRLR